MGYIKDYEGGTIMQCTMVDKVKYLDVANLISAQRWVSPLSLSCILVHAILSRAVWQHDDKPASVSFVACMRVGGL